MAFPNIFTKTVADDMIARIAKLTPTTTPKWGKMTVAQMLAHCTVAYDMSFTDKYPKPGFLAKLLLKWFVKDSVCGPKPYPQNGRTAPAFIITGDRDFNAEKKGLEAYITKCVELGSSHFEGKESPNFGAMTSAEWNTLFYKHLDHHLTQFGV
jgi:hypothetical protein